MTRLKTIAGNNKRWRTRDVLFACFIALAAALAVVTIRSGNQSDDVAQSR